MKNITYNSKEKLIKEIKFLEENTRFKNNKNFIQHGTTSIYDHVIKVAWQAIYISEKYKLRVNLDSLIRGALLHDYFLYDWHKPHKYRHIHGFTHPYTAYKNASSELKLNKIEKDIIIKHMFPLTVIPPRYLESWVVSLADKIVTVRETLNPKENNYYLLEADIS